MNKHILWDDPSGSVSSEVLNEALEEWAKVADKYVKRATAKDIEKGAFVLHFTDGYVDLEREY